MLLNLREYDRTAAKPRAMIGDEQQKASPGRVRSSPSTFAVAAATISDVPAIAALLRSAELPHEEFALHLAHFLVARDGHGNVIGAIGAEVHAPDALLRSLVVAPVFRGFGLGDTLLRQLENAASGWGVERWWLLTTTAEKFFAARRFVVSPRASAPLRIRKTKQFSGDCCGSAVCLTRSRITSRHP
jgi:amino-acid N-acetyltransferase